MKLDLAAGASRDSGGGIHATSQRGICGAECEYTIRGKDKEEISDGENKEGIWPKCSFLPSSALPPPLLIHPCSKELHPCIISLNF